MEDKIEEFEIRNPRNAIVLFIILGILSFAGLIALTVYYVKTFTDANMLIVLIVVLFLLLVLCCLGLYICLKEKFVFKDEVFTYVKPFRAKQSAAAENVAEVRVHGWIFMHVAFIDKDGNEVLKFLDDGTSFRDGKFIRALQERNIQIKHL